MSQVRWLYRKCRVSHATAVQSPALCRVSCSRGPSVIVSHKSILLVDQIQVSDDNNRNIDNVHNIPPKQHNVVMLCCFDIILWTPRLVARLSNDNVMVTTRSQCCCNVTTQCCDFYIVMWCCHDIVTMLYLMVVYITMLFEGPATNHGVYWITLRQPNSWSFHNIWKCL